MKKLIAFKGNVELKKMMIEEILKHQKADSIRKGTYGYEFDGEWKGCAVGCSIKSLNTRLNKTYSTSDHSIYEKALGIPRIIAGLEDGIFEGLELEESKKFPLKFIKAIPVGADLSMVWPKFLLWLLVDKTHGVIRFAKTEVQKKAIQDGANLYKRKIKGEIIDVNKWLEARNAAYATTTTYASYAYAAANAAATAANAAANAAAYAAATAANAAANAAAYAAATAATGAGYYAAAATTAAATGAAAGARQKARSVQAKKLLSLLSKTPINNL